MCSRKSLGMASASPEFRNASLRLIPVPKVVPQRSAAFLPEGVCLLVSEGIEQEASDNFDLGGDERLGRFVPEMNQADDSGLLRGPRGACRIGAVSLPDCRAAHA